MSNAVQRTGAPVSEAVLGPAESMNLLSAAILAPSLHNSQPWAFAIGRRHIEVYADASRQLRNADPTGRSLHIACGAAVLNLRVAAEHLGIHLRVRLLPDPSDPTLVAVAEVDGRREQPGDLGPYYPAIRLRRTNRRPFRNRSIPPAVLEALREAAFAEGATLRDCASPEELCRIIHLLHDGAVADAADLGRTTERQAWVGGRGRDDGIPARSLGPRPTRQSTVFRDLGHAVDVPRGYAQFEATPTVAILSTTHDRPVDWVLAGQALQRLLLQATTAGLAASFLNQPLEQDDLRRRVTSPATGVEHPHMIVRLGYGDAVPATPRRPLVQVRRAPRVML